MTDSTDKTVWIGNREYPKGKSMPSGFDEKISKEKEERIKNAKPEEVEKRKKQLEARKPKKAVKPATVQTDKK